MFFIRIFLRNQIFSRRNEVVKYILLLLQHASPMPVFSKLRPAAQVGHGEDSTMLQP